MNITTNYVSSVCDNTIEDKCKTYCAAYDAILKNRRLQTSLLEHAISPPTVHNTNQDDSKPWYLAELAKKFKTVSKPPNHDPKYKNFAVVPKCYYAKTEVGTKRSAGERRYLVCDDFQQTVTDIGVCATFHAANAISITENATTNDDNYKPLETKGTGGYTGLTVVLSSNLMYWQLELVEPLLVRTHDSQSFGTFIASDFTDVDKEAIQLPVMYQSDVALSVKVVETDDGFKNLDKDTRRCFLKGTDEHKFDLLTWAPYTRGNCVLDCKLSRAARRCGCVPWYLNYRRPDIGYQSCEIFGHRCFMETMMTFTAWDEDADVINVDDEGILDDDPCVCLAECDEYAYYSR